MVEYPADVSVFYMTKKKIKDGSLISQEKLFSKIDFTQ